MYVIFFSTIAPTKSPISFGLPILPFGKDFSKSFMFFTNFFARFVLNGPGAILMIDTFF